MEKLEQDYDDLTERVNQLEKALRPFANAYERLRYYGRVPTVDETVIVVTKSNTLFELFRDEGEDKGKDPLELLRVGDLENASTVLKGCIL